MANLFFDLDGTLVDSRMRLYNLFCTLCPECDLAFEEYWRIKRAKITQAQMLRKYFQYTDEEKIARFHEMWLRKVEEDVAILTDTAVDGCDELLAKLSRKYCLYVVTCRQRQELAISQIERLGFAKYLKATLVTGGCRTKVDVIRGYVSNISKDDWLIGDTGEDVLAARKLGVGSISVSWGILSRDVLKEYRPDALFDTVEELSIFLQ